MIDHNFSSPRKISDILTFWPFCRLYFCLFKRTRASPGRYLICQSNESILSAWYSDFSFLHPNSNALVSNSSSQMVFGKKDVPIKMFGRLFPIESFHLNDWFFHHVRLAKCLWRMSIFPTFNSSFAIKFCCLTARETFFATN